MKVTIEFIDRDSLSSEEIISQARQLFGKQTKVEVKPESNDAVAMLYFAIQQLITPEQVSSFYDDGELHTKKLQELRAAKLLEIEEILNRVIIDNERKLAE